MKHNEVSAFECTALLDELRTLEEMLHRSEVRASKEILEAFLAEDFLEFGASGSVYDRKKIIDLLVGDHSFYEGELLARNYSLKLIAVDAVLLTYETERIYEDGSRRCALRSSIWKHNGLSWQMIFHQGTIMPSKSST